MRLIVFTFFISFFDKIAHILDWFWDLICRELYRLVAHHCAEPENLIFESSVAISRWLKLRCKLPVLNLECLSDLLRFRLFILDLLELIFQVDALTLDFLQTWYFHRQTCVFFSLLLYSKLLFTVLLFQFLVDLNKLGMLSVKAGDSHLILHYSLL